MRYYFIFGTTIILLVVILLYNPNDKYLGVYKENVNIDLCNNEDGYEWIYISDNIIVEKNNSCKWKLKFDNSGKAKITYYYSNTGSIENAKYSILYEFNVSEKKVFWIVGEAKGLLDFPNPY